MPDLIRHPGNLWIPACVGMTAFSCSCLNKKALIRSQGGHDGIERLFLGG